MPFLATDQPSQRVLLLEEGKEPVDEHDDQYIDQEKWEVYAIVGTHVRADTEVQAFLAVDSLIAEARHFDFYSKGAQYIWIDLYIHQSQKVKYMLGYWKVQKDI